MKETMPADITRVLRRLEGGDRDSLEELLPLVYRELHALARRNMAGERIGHTLQPTALVHETYLRLAGRDEPHWKDRNHFFRAAAAIMRSILVNHARDRGRIKRGDGGRKLAWDDHFAAIEDRALDLVGLDAALEKLEALDCRQAEMIELRFFAGLTIPETAGVMGVSERTVQSDWSLARGWLLRELEASAG